MRQSLMLSRASPHLPSRRPPPSLLLQRCPPQLMPSDSKVTFSDSRSAPLLSVLLRFHFPSHPPTFVFSAALFHAIGVTASLRKQVRRKVGQGRGGRGRGRGVVKGGGERGVPKRPRGRGRGARGTGLEQRDPSGKPPKNRALGSPGSQSGRGPGNVAVKRAGDSLSCARLPASI